MSGRSCLKGPRLPRRLCTLAVLSVGLLFAAGGAQATVTGTVVAWGCGGADVRECSVPSGLSGVTAIDDGNASSWNSFTGAPLP